MKADEVTVGMKVTFLVKGSACVNTTVIHKHERYGSTFVNLRGVVDDFNDLAEVSVNDIKPVTKGWYSSDPTKAA